MPETKTEKAFNRLQKSIERIRANLERDIEAAVAKFKKSAKDCPAKNGFAFSAPRVSLSVPVLYKV